MYGRFQKNPKLKVQCKKTLTRNYNMVGCKGVTFASIPFYSKHLILIVNQINYTSERRTVHRLQIACASVTYVQYAICNRSYSLQPYQLINQS